MIMPFGKHRGCPIAEVPASYLFWVLETCDINMFLRIEIQNDLKSRLDALGEFTPHGGSQHKNGNDQNLKSDINRWCRKAAAVLHPDVGGSVEAMRMVNELRDLVK